jgi:2-methylcitrate dehydratase
MEKELQNLMIADFVLSTAWEDVGSTNFDQLKRHLLDAIGSMIHAQDKSPIKKMLAQLAILGDSGKCKAPCGTMLAYDRAAQLFTALIRYPDFMDNYMGKEATCHPSDNIGPLLAAGQFSNSDGKHFLLALAIAYQVQCRLVEEIPVMKEGIDHTLLLAYSMTCGIGRLIGLDREQLAHALGIAGSFIAPTVTSRASYTYEWKGMASSMDALDCMNIAFLAAQGMTGPIALFEGPKGFAEVFGMKLDYNWKNEKFNLISKCVLKRYNAEVHSQASIDQALKLSKLNGIDPTRIKKVSVTTFLTAYHIIGSGAYGNRKVVHSKEQADHSLHYLIAVALLDGDVLPGQFTAERIMRNDVQELLQKVEVDTKLPFHKPTMVAGMLDPYTQSYPEEMRTSVEIELEDGTRFSGKQSDYPGFFTRPLGWDEVIEKFTRLSDPFIDRERQEQIADCIRNLEQRDLAELVELIC